MNAILEVFCTVHEALATATLQENIDLVLVPRFVPTTARWLMETVNRPDLPPVDEIPTLADTFRRLGAEEIVHAAGCVDYFHTENLAAGNVALTRAFVRLGQALHARRFTFISTAFVPLSSLKSREQAVASLQSPVVSPKK